MTPSTPSSNSCCRERGVTLIETMVVIVVIGILASVATASLGKTSSRAEITMEVNRMFTQFHLGQARHHAETDRYVSTGDAETDAFPEAPAGTRSRNTTEGMPDTWAALGISNDSLGLYCSFTAVAGVGGDHAKIGSVAEQFGFAAPAIDWYYLVAECDMDNRGGTNSLFFASSGTEGVFKLHDGR